MESTLKLYFEVMACIARADGEIREEEREMLLASASASELSAEDNARLGRLLDANVPFSIADMLATTDPDTPAAVLAEIIKDGCMLCLSDGSVEIAELEVLRALLNHCGYSEAASEVLLEWGRKAAEVHADGLRLAAELRTVK